MFIDIRTILPSTFIYIQSVQAARNLASRHLAHFSCSTRPHQVPSKRILSPNLAACLRHAHCYIITPDSGALTDFPTHHIPYILPCACTYILPLSARGRVISTQSVVVGYSSPLSSAYLPEPLSRSADLSTEYLSSCL